MKHITIYTDGACSGNPGPGGWAAILLYGNAQKEISGGYKNTTNNRMELLAVINALSALNEMCKVTLICDSNYVVQAVNKGWLTKWKENNWKRNKREKTLNVDLWLRLLPLLEKHEVTLCWTQGHNDNTYNERCDKLAVAASRKKNLLEDLREHTEEENLV
ncbi:MAG: ribonuclease HI [Ignavibacteria bacterium]|nr:ribonuclease HI [Ignavibacteria bacterium]